MNTLERLWGSKESIKFNALTFRQDRSQRAFISEPGRLRALNPREVRMLKKLGLQVVVVLAGALFFSANAQTTTVGTISGTIRDEKGAVVPRAEVSIQGEGTGTSRTVK